MNGSSGIPARDFDPDIAVPLFAALGDHTRLHLLAELANGDPRSITDLAARTTLTRQAVTKHLEVLESVELVRSCRRSRQRIFEIQPQRLEVARRYLAMIESRWDDALARLRSHLASDLQG